jgi:hypothetical protein
MVVQLHAPPFVQQHSPNCPPDQKGREGRKEGRKEGKEENVHI